jgi:hypothetical protein
MSAIATNDAADDHKMRDTVKMGVNKMLLLVPVV